MLVQSHEPGKIYLLPALPTTWSTGTVKGLKCGGNYEVAISWKDGDVVQASISSPIGGKVTVYTGDRAEEVTLKAGESRQIF